MHHSRYTGLVTLVLGECLRGRALELEFVGSNPGSASPEHYDLCQDSSSIK